MGGDHWFDNHIKSISFAKHRLQLPVHTHSARVMYTICNKNQILKISNTQSDISVQ